MTIFLTLRRQNNNQVRGKILVYGVDSLQWMFALVTCCVWIALEVEVCSKLVWKKFGKILYATELYLERSKNVLLVEDTFVKVARTLPGSSRT